MQEEHFKWITLENTDGTATLKQHAFIPKVCHQKYTGEEYVGNVSLCGKVFADDGTGDEQVGMWVLLKGEARVNSCCKVCKTKYVKFLE